MNFREYYKLVLFSPVRGFQALIKDDRLVRLAFLAVVIQVIAYTLVYVCLIYGAERPLHPWMDIPEEVYYPRI